MGLTITKVLMASLREMPSFLFESFAGLPETLHTKPGPGGGFSPVEQAWHLADLEIMGFSERIRRLRDEPNPQLPNFEGEKVAQERNYKSLSMKDGIEAFRRARERNISAFSVLTSGELSNMGELEDFGPVSLCDLPLLMNAHDESHRLEIEAWLNCMKIKH